MTIHMTNELKSTSLKDALGNINADLASPIAKAVKQIDWDQINLTSQLLGELHQGLLKDIRDSLTQSFAKSVLTEIELPKITFPKIQLPEVKLPPFDFGEIDQRIHEALVLLGRGGWYLYEEMTFDDLYGAAHEISEGNFADADTRMCSIYENDYDAIKNRILKEFPSRAQVLSRAFQAHERGEYELSVPVFLAQADGICQDAINVQLYSKRADKKPKAADVVDRAIVSSFHMAILAPLTTSLPLIANPAERQSPDYPPGALNRHEVLHGESVDYGIRTNSFKAISLLHYLCDALKQLRSNAA